MKIVKVNAYPLNATFEKYFGGIEKVPVHYLRPSANFTVSPRLGQFSTLVEIICDNDLRGYGECFGIPNAIHTAHYVQKTFESILCGQDPLNIFKLSNMMEDIASGIGNTAGPMMEAISGIDMALWDLKGKFLGVPIYQLLGGKLHDSIYCYATPIMMMETIEQTQARTKELLGMGFTALKIKGGRDIETDLKHIAAVRNVAGKDVKLLLDLNCGYNGRINEAITLAREAEQYNLYWFEEPVSPDNLDAYAIIKSKINLPLVTGENDFSFNAFKRIISSKYIDIIMPNLGRAGGITGSYKINMFASANNVLLSPHGVGAGISMLAALHLMTAADNALCFEYNQFLNPLRHGIMKNKIQYANSYITLSDAPGLGVEINWDTVNTYLVQI